MMRDIETAWQELLSTATLGSERRALEAPPIQGQLGELIHRIDATNPERYLLGVSAAMALFLKSGRIPQVNSVDPLPTCDPDELPLCSPPAASRLATILSGQYREILPEWLNLASKNCKRVPEELLPVLLDWGETHLGHVELILPVIGRRGRWLAVLNPAWAGIQAALLAESPTNELLEEAWQIGARSSRRALLRLLRGRRVPLGQDLLASTWAEESAADRSAFLAEFEINLSMEDEPFLEAALDDRSKDVRQAAASLLACLPQSRLVERMTRRVQLLLKLETAHWPLRRPRIEVLLPEEYDAELSRNGIESRLPRGEAIGEKAWWLLQMLGTIPPSVWNRTWNKSSEELLEIAKDGDWCEPLHEGWAIAALRHRDADWAESLLRIYPSRTLLLEVMEPSKREDYIQGLIQSQPKEGVAAAIGYHHPWSQKLTALVLQNLRRYYHTDQGTFYPQLRQALLSLGLYMHPGSVPDVERNLREREDGAAAWEQAVQSLLLLLEFRCQMIEELTS